MYRTRLRALLAGATSASLIMLLILPAGALGGPPSRESDRGVFVDCEFLTSDDGTLFFGGFLSEVNGTSAGLEAFGPGGEPFEDPPTFVTSPDEDPTGSYVDGQFTLQIPVVDGTTGEPGGSAMIQATLEAVGRPEHFNDAFGFGNHKNRDAGSISDWLCGFVQFVSSRSGYRARTASVMDSARATALRSGRRNGGA